MKDKFEFKKYKDDEKIDEKLLLEFYQTVLKLDSTKKQITLDYYYDFNVFVNKKYNSLDDFETELKKTCYIIETFNISEDLKDELIDKFN
jgi:hypothetical protein